MVVVRWTGAAGVELTHAGDSYLLDPYHSRVGKLALVARALQPDVARIETYLREVPGRLRAVLVGHTHFDHALDIPAIAARFDGPLVGSSSLAALMERHGRRERVTVCAGGDRVDLPGGAAVTMIPSIHSRIALGRVPYPGEIDPRGPLPMRTREYCVGEVFAPRVEIGGTSIVFLGSANLLDAELARERCDVLFACVPGWQRTPDFHARVFAALQPRILVPYHFDDFSVPWSFDRTAPNVPLLDVRAFLRRAKEAAPDVRIIVPRPFEAMTFQGPVQEKLLHSAAESSRLAASLGGVLPRGRPGSAGILARRG